jgi:ferredoxin-thioredoxin reductase catalytic subunit
MRRGTATRLASGDKQQDLDIVWPCGYRDADLGDYGTCYCGPYVSQAVLNGQRSIVAIPERRPLVGKRKKLGSSHSDDAVSSLPFPVWR